MALLTTPLLVVLVVALIGGVARFRGRRILSRVLVGSAVALFLVCAFPPFADWFLGRLEHRYPPLAENLAVTAGYVVVFGSGYYPSAAGPITAQIDEDGLRRAVEGMRLSRQYHLPVVFSGGAVRDSAASAVGYGILAKDLGVDATTMIVSPDGSDTRNEVLALKKLVGDKPIVAVTSASHMPRVMAMLQRAGMAATAAPTAQRIQIIGGPGKRHWMPSTLALHETELAIHEYLGLAAMRLGLD